MYVSAIGIQPRLDTYILLHHYTAPDMSQNDKVPENGEVRSLDCPPTVPFNSACFYFIDSDALGRGSHPSNRVRERPCCKKYAALS